MHRSSRFQAVLIFCAALILSLSACFNRSLEKPNPLGARLSQTPAAFTIQEGPFTYEKDIITNPDKIDALTQLLRKAKWEPAPGGPEGAESLRLQLDGDSDALLVFFARGDGSALCQNSAGEYYALDAKSYDQLYALMTWAKGTVVSQGEVLDRLWEEYLHDTYYTLNNGGTWSSAEELRAEYFAEYALFQYLSRDYLQKGNAIPAAPDESGIWCVMGSNGESDRLYITRAAVSAYAVKYLNFPADYDPLAYSEPPQWAYDSELDAFYIKNGDIKSMAHQNFAPRVPRSDYDSGLEQVRMRDDGSISAVYARYDLLDDRRVVEFATVYRLQTRASSDPLYGEYPYYFTGVERIYVNNGQTSVTVGEDTTRRVLDPNTAFPQNAYPPTLRLLAENDGTLIFQDSTYDNNALFTLHLVDKNNLSLIKRVSPPDKVRNDGYDFFGVERRGDRIYARMRDRILSYSLTLEEEQEIALPAPLLALKDSTYAFDADGIALRSYYSGYDFNDDFSRFAYVDIEGLKLLDAASGKASLIDPVIPQRTPMGMGKRLHSTPRFVDNGKKLLATYSGYESNAGWLLYDLAAQKNLNISGGGYGFVGEAGDNGLLFIDYDYSTQGHNAVFTRFSDGAMHTLSLRNTIAQTDIPTGGWYVINDRYVAFVVSPPGASDGVYRPEYWIHRLDLNTLETKERLLSVTGAHEVKLWGVLEDGTVLYNYYYNPAEKETGFVR